MKFVKKKVIGDNQAQEVDNEFDDADLFNFEQFGEDFEQQIEVTDL